MRWVVRPRQGGKTRACVEWVMAAYDRALVVTTWEEKERLVHDHGVPETQVVVAFAGPGVARRSVAGRRVAVDDADVVLRALLRSGPVELVTGTAGEPAGVVRLHWDADYAAVVARLVQAGHVGIRVAKIPLGGTAGFEWRITYGEEEQRA